MDEPLSADPASRARQRQFRLSLVLAAACTVPAGLDALQTLARARLHGEPTRWQDVVFQGTEWLFLGALLPLATWLGVRTPLRAPWIRALAVHCAGALALCVGWASLGVALGTLLDRYPAGDYVGWLLTSVPWSVFMYFTVVGCVQAALLFDEARAREAQATRLSAQLAEARLGALRQQLRPHFLFNSLNAVAVLVRDGDTRGASRMLTLVGDLLRHVLRTEQTHEVPLAEEMAFVERYLAIEEVRFSDRLRVTWSVDPAAAPLPVPSLILQPIVENAVAHGVASRADAGRLSIGARLDGTMLVLVVENDGARLQLPVQEGVGLRNTRERLRTLYGDAARLTLEPLAAGGARVQIVLPVRRPGA